MAAYPLNIHDRASLEEASNILHDARFMPDGIHSDGEARTFSMNCWVHSHLSVGRVIGSHWRVYRLSFSEVIKARVIRNEDVRFYEIATLWLENDPSKLEIVTHYGCEINLEITSLRGVLQETEESRTDW